MIEFDINDEVWLNQVYLIFYMFKRVDLRNGSVNESLDTRDAGKSRPDFERQLAGNIDKMLEAMTYNKDDAAIFLDKPFTKTNWMVNVLEENLSLRQSDLNGPLIEIIERILANNEGIFRGVFHRLNAEGYSKKIFAERLLAIITEIMDERERIRDSINEII